jgi:hypothetical protein
VNCRVIFWEDKGTCKFVRGIIKVVLDFPLFPGVVPLNPKKVQTLSFWYKVKI